MIKSCRREFKRRLFERSQKETRLEGIITEDFGPGVERRGWGLRDGPELSERVMDEGDGGSIGGGDAPASAEEVDLVIGVDPPFQVEGQMQIQKR